MTKGKDNEIRIQSQIGLEKTDQKDYAGALADYDRALELDPDNDLVLENRSILKAELNR